MRVFQGVFDVRYLKQLLKRLNVDELTRELLGINYEIDIFLKTSLDISPTSLKKAVMKS